MSDKLGRNDPCKCGSGKKYKNCCLKMPTGSKKKFGASIISSQAQKIQQPKPVDLMERTFGASIAKTKGQEEQKQRPAPTSSLEPEGNMLPPY